jgi:outer membrane protein
MKRSFARWTVFAFGSLFTGAALAADLVETYRLAKQNDSQFAAARAQLEAGLERLPQGRALLLPIINGAANTAWNEAENKTFGFPVDFNSNGWNVTLTQPVFRWQNVMQYRQAGFQVQQAEAQFGQSIHDLIVRVAQAYFDVLAAQDSLEFIKANKVAIEEQLAQAKRNFEVGTATITDTNEAQARYDLAVAQEIAGQNALEVAQRALQQIIGTPPSTLTPLRPDLTIEAPQPNSMEDWVASARGGNFGVKANEAAFEIATREIERRRAGHYPNLDLVARHVDNTTLSVTTLGTPRVHIQQSSIGLELSVPIYAGGSVNSLTREAVSLRERARQDLETSRRAAEFNARQSFLNVTNGMAQVKALEQALVSSDTALQSNKVGYEVGVRINIDVLNAQQQVFQTKRDLSRARYDTILNGLRLKAAAGTLNEADVEAVNRLLGS